MAEQNHRESGEAPSEASAAQAASVPDASAAALAAKQAALTPGQRLAAKKAQKAVEKRESKEERKRAAEDERQREQAEVDRLYGRVQPTAGLPEDVQKVAGSFTRFLQTHRERILLGVVSAIVLVGVAFAVQRFVRAGSAEQAAELGKALELAQARIDPQDQDGKSDDGKPLFKSADARSEQACTAFERAAKAGPDRPAGAWALLGEAANELTLGKFEPARAHFQGVYDAHADDPELAARALEGVGVSLEAAGKTDQALKAYEKLKSVGGSQELAEFQIARLKLAQGDREGGKSMLKKLYDQLSSPSEGSAPSPYLKNEVELRLAELDSSLVDKGRVGDQPQQFSEEQLQRLIEQLQKKSKGAGGANPE
ncbi:MAG TPA: tetratricopeptide repeat protein [Polyangiaceae bacterium]|nr:tetratricopeptide repeat protein [Polyangiaceae bacterium]